MNVVEAKLKIYISLQLSLRSSHSFRKISEIKLPSEAAIRMHFSISLFGSYVEIL